MAHISLNELAERLAHAEEEVERGARYVHYKDPTKEYVVKSFGILEATEEVGVVYEASYDTRISFVRPLSSFCGMVEVEGKSVPRFTKV